MSNTKDWGPEYRRHASQAAEEAKWTIGKWIGVIVLIMIAGTGIGLLGGALGWFSEAGQVAKEEFGPRAALEKYEWFVEQAKAIEKADKDIALFEARRTNVKSEFAGYGEDMAKWPLHIQAQYNQRNGQAHDDLLAVVSNRNNLVKDYNAASSKFNWTPFQTKPDKPRERYFDYVVK